MMKRRVLRCIAAALCISVLAENGNTGAFALAAGTQMTGARTEAQSAEGTENDNKNAGGEGVVGEDTGGENIGGNVLPGEDIPAAEDQILIVAEEGITEREAGEIADTVDAVCVDTVEIGGESTVAVLEIDGADTVEEAVAKAEENPEVIYAQPNYRYEVEKTDDPYSGNSTQQQWYLERIGAEEAWEEIDILREAQDIEPVKVAILDTGADISHEDLQAALNQGLSGETDGGSGFVPLTGDKIGHGTHIAGIIGATAGNQKGIAGAASGGTQEKSLVDLIALAINDPERPDSLYTSTLVKGIERALENDTKVINMSLGGYGKDWILEKAVADAYDRGTLCVCAAGNDGTSDYSNPSDYGETVGIMNMTSANTMASGSNYGTAKDLAAPGTNIYSTWPGSVYQYQSGTSMAAPMVTAAAAMVYAVNPGLTAEQVRNILCATADQAAIQGAGSEGTFNERSGYGLVSADAAVEAAAHASDAVPAESISFKEDTLEIDQEETIKLQTLVLPATALGVISWESSNDKIASVDENGRITGENPGTAVVTARIGGCMASVTVTVNGDLVPEGVEFYGVSTDKMTIGESFRFSARVTPSNACDKTICWTSSDQKVAAVDEDGWVYAKSAGNVTITAEAYNGKSASVKIAVGPTAQGIAFTGSTAKLLVGKSFAFQVKTTPADALGFAGVSYTSSNSSVISVNAKTGLATAKSPGKATVTACTANGKQCSVKVTAYSTSYSGKTYGLSASSTAYNKIGLKWKSIANADGYIIERSVKKKSGYKKIASVSGGKTSYTDKKRVTGKQYYYRIRAYYSDGGKKYCGYSSKVSAKAIPGTPKITVKKGKRKAALKWKKINGASGYIIYRSTNKKKGFKKIAVVKGGSKKSYINKGLVSGKKYYYKVKAYRKVSAKKNVYGKASGVKGV